VFIIIAVQLFDCVSGIHKHLILWSSASHTALVR
jgi:hypothetical protein